MKIVYLFRTDKWRGAHLKFKQNDSFKREKVRSTIMSMILLYRTSMYCSQINVVMKGITLSTTEKLIEQEFDFETNFILH